MQDDATPPTRRDFAMNIQGALSSDWIGTGPLARLRRMNLTDLSEPTLHWLLARHDVPEAWLSTSNTSPDGMSKLQCWGLWIHCAALAAPGNLAHHRIRFGVTLWNAGLSEARFIKLLQTRPSHYPDILPRMIRHVVAKREPIDALALFDLIWFISKDDASAESQRRQLANSYYRAQRSHQQESP